MKFLIDAHVPYGLCRLLSAQGHDVLHTRDLVDGGATKDRVQINRRLPFDPPAARFAVVPLPTRLARNYSSASTGQTAFTYDNNCVQRLKSLKLFGKS